MKAKLNLENELRDLISRLISQVSIAAKQSRLDINLASEDAWIPILREVFQAPKLENLNRHQRNYPGIDLGDLENRICFQVTATTDIEKVKDTVRIFIDKKYDNAFDDLYVFTLLPRQKTYSQESIDKIVGNTEFKFSTKEHIIDPEMIAGKIGSMRFATQQRMLRELKSVVGDVDAKLSALEAGEDVPYVFASNLIPIEYPQNIYSALVDIDQDRVWEAAKEFLPSLPRKKTVMSCLYLSLEMAGYDNAPFVFHEGKIFTFIDLEVNSPFSGLIDEGTIEPHDTEDFYQNEHIEYENIFKQLLKSCMRSILAKDQVGYIRKERLFYFEPKKQGDSSRKISWKDKKSSTRTVYDQLMESKESTSIYAHRHFAFDVTFTKIECAWYGIIYPSWRFTYKLARKHLSNDSLVASKKRLEKNHSVRDHIRFIACYVRELAKEQKSIIDFGTLIEFEFTHKEIVDLSEEPAGEEYNNEV